MESNFFSKTLIIESTIMSLAFYKFPFSTLILTSILGSFYFYENYISIHKKKGNFSENNSKFMIACVYDDVNTFKVSNKVEIPKLTENEALIKVKASAINPIDYKVITCKLPFIRYFLPPTVGRDFSGIVIDLGNKVKNFKIGDEVYGNAKNGSLQQYTIVDPNQIALKPKNLSFSESASIGLAACTSFQALKFFGDIHNKKVLIIGGSGGCGSFGIQIAKYYGATVYAVCGSKNVEFVESLGADKVLDYSKDNYLENIENEKFDLIYDTVSSPEDPDQFHVYKKFLKEDAKWVAINGSIFDFLKAIFRAFLGINLEKKNFHITLLKWNTKDLNTLSKIAEERKIKTHIKLFKLNDSDVKDAFNILKSRRTVGKLVFEIDI